MVSVMQIFDAKITYKTVQEVQEVRKTLTKNNDGSLILRYEMKALGEGITNLVPESKMDKVSVVIWFDQRTRLRVILNGSGRV